MPDEDNFKRYSNIIRSLSTKYSTPIFEPHVTLLGGLSDKEDFLIKGTSETAAALQTFMVRFIKTDYFNEYFRSLFVLVEKTPELNRAWNTAASRFDLNPNWYMPHMSLIYGDIPEETKQDIIKDLKTEAIREGFLASRLALYSTDGPVAEWHEISSFDLNQP